jgi:hypothetical protein
MGALGSEKVSNAGECFRMSQISDRPDRVIKQNSSGTSALLRWDGENILLHEFPCIGVDFVGERVIVVVVIFQLDIVDGKS